MLKILLPGHGLPDPEFFFTHGHPSITETGDIVDQQLRQSFDGFIGIVLQLSHRIISQRCKVFPSHGIWLPCFCETTINITVNLRLSEFIFYPLSFAICHLFSVIRHLFSAICHLFSVIRHLSADT